MKGKDAVNDGVDRLAMVEGVGDKAEVARRGGGMEAEMGDWRGVAGHQLRADAGRRGKDVQSRVTLYLASARCVLETPGIDWYEWGRRGVCGERARVRSPG